LEGNVGAKQVLENRPNFKSPKEMFWYAVENYPDTIALIQEKEQVTYKELGNGVLNFGEALQAKMATHTQEEKKPLKI